MKKLEINKMILTRYNVLTKQAMLLARNLETDAKRHPIRVGAWVHRWVAKGKSAIKSQGAYKVQNLKMPFGLRVPSLLRGKHGLSTDKELFWKASGLKYNKLFVGYLSKKVNTKFRN